MNKTTALLLSQAALLGFIPSLSADEAGTATSLWGDFDIALGVTAAYEPDYQGSDDYEISVLPLLAVTYKDWLYLEGSAVGAFWRLTDDIQLQTGVAYEEGRAEGDNDALEGLDDIKDTAVLDAGLFYEIDDLTLGVALELDLLGRGKGLVTFFGAKYDFELLDDRLEISPQVDISFGNGEHLRTEFGIDDDEAVNSAFDAYRPSAGLKSYGLGLGLDYALTEHWSLLGETAIEFYGPEAKDSPLLDEAGADYGAEIEISVAYRF